MLEMLIKFPRKHVLPPLKNNTLGNEIHGALYNGKCPA